MDWIDLDQDSDRWRALVNAVVNHFFPKKIPEISWLTKKMLASQERLWSVELVN